MMENTKYRNGLIYALSCAIIWGFLPIYWNALNPISSLAVIFYRVALMAPTCFAIQYYHTKSIKKMYIDHERNTLCTNILRLT